MMLQALSSRWPLAIDPLEGLPGAFLVLRKSFFGRDAAWELTNPWRKSHSADGDSCRWRGNFTRGKFQKKPLANLFLVS
jgi:hypothetical protein